MGLFDFLAMSLQASHVLIDVNGRAKLCGLRYSCSLYESVAEATTSASVGCLMQDRYDYPLYVSRKNLNWMSPEILQQVSPLRMAKILSARENLFSSFRTCSGTTKNRTFTVSV